MIYDAIEVFIRYGLSWGAVAVLLVRNRRLRRYINNHLPKLLRDHTDGDMAEIKRDIKRIKEHLGVVECSSQDGGSAHSALKKSSRLLNLFTKVTFLKKLLSRRNQKMKQYLKKLGSRKFQSFVVGFATQVFILLEVDVAPYVDAIAAGGLVITTIAYIWVEGSSDKASIQRGASELEPNYNSSDSTSE